MTLSDLFLHRRSIGRRIGQLLFLFLILCLATYVAHSVQDDNWRFGLLGVILLFGIFKLITWELRIMSGEFGLTILPPAWGTFRGRSTRAEGRFLSLLELGSRFKWKTGGLFIGRPLPEQQFFGLAQHMKIGPVDDRHMLTVAGARSGKGTAAIIPNLLTYPGSVVVFDPKGELAQITAPRRGHGSDRVTEFLGQDVFILDPEDTVSGLSRACWNPLAELDLSDLHLWGKVARICASIISTVKTGGDQDFFVDYARDFLQALVIHVLTTEPPENHNLIFVRKLITQGDKELFDILCDEAQGAGVPCAAADAFEATLLYMVENQTHGGNVSGFAQNLLRIAPETQSGIYGELRRQTNFLDHYSMVKTLQTSDFCLEDIQKRPTTVYLCLSASSLSTDLVKFVSMFFDLAVAKVDEGKSILPHKVLFIIDEFYVLGRMESIDKAMGLMAYKLTLWPIVQHFGQLKKHYPSTYDNFIRNCRAVQYFGDQEPEVLRELEKRIGERIIRKSDGLEQRQPLLSFNEMSASFLTKDSRRQIVCFNQQPAAVLELVDYYKSFPKHWYEADRTKR
jgi:type IV secretion system protein VirD4